MCIGMAPLSILRVFLLLAAIAGAAALETGRWRYGSISWRRKEPDSNSSRKVIFTVESAWRYSHGSMVKFGTDQKAKAGDTVKILASDGQDPLFAFGDGNVTARYDVLVYHVDPIQDLLVGTSSFEWDYWAPGPWNATLTLCCRVAENQNGMKSIMLQSIVDLSKSSVLGSPRVRMIPRIALQAFGNGGDMQQFEVPATAAEGFESRSEIRWQDVPELYWKNLMSLAPNSTIYKGVNATSGLASVDVGCFRGGCVQDLNIVVSVARQGASGMVDFVVRVQKNDGDDAVPSLTLKAPEDNPMLKGQEKSTLGGMPVVDAFADFGVEVTFKASDARLEETFFEYNILPSGAVKADRVLVDPLTQTYAQTIRWQPSVSQVSPPFAP
jgi:hypothetical protein